MLDAGSTNPPPACTFHSEPRFAASLSRRPSLRGPRMTDRPAFFRHEEPGCARHVIRFLHRRHTTISLDCHFPLLPLGKPRRARPDVAFRGRVGGGWGREKRSSTASCRSNVARRRAAGAQRWRSMASTRACSRRRPRPRTRGRGRRPRTAGGHGDGNCAPRRETRPTWAAVEHRCDKFEIVRQSSEEDWWSSKNY